MLDNVVNFLQSTGVYRLFADNPLWWQTALMFVISAVLVYLAVVRGFEPLLLLPIAIRSEELV